MRTIRGIVKSLRPQQWIKNFFLFAGIIFSGRFFDIDALSRSIGGFFAFCFLASAVYFFNDIKDLEFDRVHPDKKNRPIAHGDISIPFATIFGILLLAIGILLSISLGSNFFFVAGSYIILQFLYIYLFKRMPILDILAVAAGFVIRAIAGGVVIDVPISSWLLVCTSLLALFLVTEKRRGELSRIEDLDLDTSSRPSLSNYTVTFLDQLANIELVVASMAYMLYVFSAETRQKFGGYALGFTIPFVLYGLFRYLWLVNIKGKGESPTKIFLTDFPSVINLVLWAIVVFIVVYIK